ncbi:(2Fe-2S)-binding protein [Nocardia asteroides]|uniref:(2Fe-2S)-binding protein n=1 Tax=Nocardia asteroides TaxID=1824 RepID=UPI001E5336AC|nr:(2Fe-2S)-binding protein [Nocardia asteroides]UGT63322.1 (2Fe-2S)-binding protein [Nocardia asteroides]
MTETVGGAALRDPAWVTARIAEMGRNWGTDSCRAAGTLWWCMVASALVQPVVGAYAARSAVPTVELDRISCPVRADGGIETISLADDPAPDPRAAAHALRASLASVIATVAQASGAGIPALWAVVADAIGNRAIDAGTPAIAPALAHDVGGKLPKPRFQEVAGRTFVKRISCCLVFEAPGCAMCTSCPKRPAAEREQLLTALTTGN